MKTPYDDKSRTAQDQSQMQSYDNFARGFDPILMSLCIVLYPWANHRQTNQ